MAEWNQTRNPETREVATCRGVIRLSAATERAATDEDWTPAPPPGATDEHEQRPKVLVVGLGPAGCACAARLRQVFGARIELRCAEAGRSIGEKSGIRRLGGTEGSEDADVGAQRVSIDGYDPASAHVLHDFLQHVPGLEHVDDGLLSYGSLARTSERPGGWNRATGQWEHFRIRGGNVNLLRHLIDSASVDKFSFGRPVLLAAASEDAIYDIDDLSCAYAAVIVACGSKEAMRCAINLDTEGCVAKAAKLVAHQEVCVRAYAATSSSGETADAGITVSTGAVAVARAAPAIDGDVVARRVLLRVPENAALVPPEDRADGGAALYEAVLRPTAPPPAGAKINKAPYVVCSERPLVVVAGDWCAGGGSVDRALASGVAAASYVAERLVVPEPLPKSPDSQETVS